MWHPSVYVYCCTCITYELKNDSWYFCTLIWYDIFILFRFIWYFNTSKNIEKRMTVSWYCTFALNPFKFTCSCLCLWFCRIFTITICMTETSMLTRSNDFEFNNPLIFDDNFHIDMQHTLWFFRSISWFAYDTHIYVYGIECNCKTSV